MFVSDISDTVSSNREYTVLCLSLSSCTRQLYVDKFDLHYYKLFFMELDAKSLSLILSIPLRAKVCNRKSI